MNADDEGSQEPTPYDSTTARQSDTSRIPEVGELEDRLRDVDAAMELLQAGELDAAEAAIEALESRVSRTE